MKLHTIPNAVEYVEPADVQWEMKDARYHPLSSDPAHAHYKESYESLEHTKHLRLYDNLPVYIKDYCDEKFEQYNCSILKQNPGWFLPQHLDQYYFFIEKYGHADNVVRFNIFLQSRKPGHFLEQDGVNVLDWSAGQYLIMDQTNWHCSSNAGILPKYTAQITGILN